MSEDAQNLSTAEDREPVIELVMPVAPPIDPPTADVQGAAVVDYELPSLRTRAIHSTAWTVLGFGSSQIIRFGSSMILSRLLSPNDFGMAGLIGTVISGLSQCSDLGLGPSIIQNRRGDDEKFLNTAWTIMALRGAALCLLSMAIAWPLSRFYHNQMLFTICIVGAWNAVLYGLNSTSLFTLNRQLNLGLITMVELSSQIGATVVMIVMAVRHPDVWAIVIGGLAGTVVKLMASHMLIPGWSNHPAWDRESVRELFSPFTGWIMVSTALTFFANESDRLILPKFVAIETLGIYYLALTLVRLPTEMISRLAGMTVFPVLSQAGSQAPEVLRSRFYQVRALILPAGAAATISLMVASPIFFGRLYTYKWLAAGWMAQLMAIGAWATILQLTADRALLAIGHTRPLALSNAANMCVTFAGAIVGNLVGERFFHGRGMEGFILGVAAGNYAGHIVIQISLARHHLPIYRQDFVYTLLLAILAGVGLGIPALLRRISPQSQSGRHAAAAWAILVITVACVLAGRRIWRWMRAR